MTHPIPLFLALLLAFALAICDGRTGRMPNALTLGALPLALAIRTLVEGEYGCVSAAVGLFVVAVVPGALFFFTRGRAIGGGDVKGLAALGAFCGPSLGLELALIAFVALAVFGGAQEALRGGLTPLLQRTLSLAALRPKPSEQKPQSQDSCATASSNPVPPAYRELRLGPALFLGAAFSCGSALLTPSAPGALQTPVSSALVQHSPHSLLGSRVPRETSARSTSPESLTIHSDHEEQP